MDITKIKMKYKLILISCYLILIYFIFQQQEKTDIDKEGNITKLIISQINNQQDETFTIHILTWNRPRSFERLMDSINGSDYGSDKINLVVHVDGGKESEITCHAAHKIKWIFGDKQLVISRIRKGLAQAWFQAWYPKSKNNFAAIFEDDIIVSKSWYMWLKNAWEAYSERSDIAGISLQRQQLIPKKPSKNKEIINNHTPFLYALLGSIGFSPHPVRWKEFIDWLSSINMERYDVSIPYLITSDWLKSAGPKGHMWEQHYIYFCNKYKLYTLYINLPSNETLAAHMWEKGQHVTKTKGQDFILAKNVSMYFPKILNKYDWAGKLET